MKKASSIMRPLDQTSLRLQIRINRNLMRGDPWIEAMRALISVIMNPRLPLPKRETMLEKAALMEIIIDIPEACLKRLSIWAFCSLSADWHSLLLSIVISDCEA